MILSKTGREVMIKVVAQSLPTYGMSALNFSTSFCDEIKSLIAQFWLRHKIMKERFIGSLEKLC